ncbi:MAG: hypothetical protein ACOYOV_00365 [Bacteroidales bacterium]
MSEIPKKRQALFSDLGKALGVDDEEAIADLLRNRDPMAIRNELGTMLGQHVRENYDSPLNAFKNKEILSQVPIEHTKLPSDIAGRYNLGENKIYLPHENLEIPSRQMGTKLHELGHADDVLTKGVTSAQPLSEVANTLKGEGLENALKAFGKHHEGGFFEKEALQSLLKGGKLGLSALAPLAKIAGPAAAIYGMSQGDAFAADPTGMLQTDELGKGSDVVPEDNEGEKQKYNNRFKKIRDIMGAE